MVPAVLLDLIPPLALEMLRCPSLGNMNMWTGMGQDGMNHPVKPKQRAQGQGKQLLGTPWVSF